VSFSRHRIVIADSAEKNTARRFDETNSWLSDIHWHTFLSPTFCLSNQQKILQSWLSLLELMDSAASVGEYLQWRLI